MQNLLFIPQAPAFLPSPHGQQARSSAPYDPAQDRRDFHVWSEAMKDGHYQLGWALNNRWNQHWPSAHKFWKHGALAGQRIDLAGLHGLGDVVQMMRFVPYLQEIGCQVRCFVQDELTPIMRMFSGMGGVECEAIDDQGAATRNALEVMELPYLLRCLPSTVSSGPYLHIPQVLSSEVRVRMGPCQKKRAGIVWTGSAHDPDRWIPVGALAPLFEGTSLEWWNMQGGIAAQEAKDLKLRHAIEVVRTPGLDNFCALIANLDLMVTTDTLAAHLAGAMGVPVWILLKHDADWRWMRNRHDSPWYPSARLFRQHSPGDWGGILAEVRHELAIHE